MTPVEEMGWLIDPEDRSIFVYQPGQVEMLDEPKAVLPLPRFMAEITYKVGDLFGLLVL